MENTYGYKPLSYELITLLRSGAPDFAAAEELIRRGADVNDQGDNKGENVLSEILWGYWQTRTGDVERGECSSCDRNYEWCEGCPKSLNPDAGTSMLKVIRFFLAHGYDVGRNDGRHGAQCLNALHLSTFDHYMIDCLKLLLDAGAKNIPCTDDPESTPLEGFNAEQSFQDACEHNHRLGNIYEAAYRVLIAADEGHPYAGIDSFETAIGKRILYVMADGETDAPVFTSVYTEKSKHDNCFYCNLYLLFEGGFLVCEREASYYVDTCLPDAPLLDVSGRFPPLIGQTIDKVSFSHNDIAKERVHYGQPITTLHLSNGHKLNFTINFGEEDRDHYCSYFYFS